MKRGLALGLLAAASVGAAVVYSGMNGGGGAEARPAEPSAAEAHALGARWRATRDETLARDYAHALIGAGLYDELLKELERGLFADDETAARLYRAEASLRQGRYLEAAAAAAPTSSPYFAYARARAGYALTADADAVAEDLRAALRGPKELRAQAWLFRARLALDANDEETARAAARRALEAGADARQAEALALESMIREGDLDAASARLLERSKKKGRAGPDADDLRLAAIAELRAGDAKAAARLADEAMASRADNARLLAALAKWLSGDDAQAYALTAAELASAPRNWIALDLASAVARDMGRAKEAESLLERLGEEQPHLAAVRRWRVAAPDAVFESLLDLAADEAANGAAAALLGADVDIAGALAEPSESERRTIALARAIRGGDARLMKIAATAATEGAAAPLTLALVGEVLRRAGDEHAADAMLSRAIAADGRFFAPARLRAELQMEQGEPGLAVATLESFLKQNAGHQSAEIALAMLRAETGELRAAAEMFAAVPPSAVFAEAATAERYAEAATAAGPGARKLMLRRAMEHSPSSLIYGKVLAASGETEAAAGAFRAGLIADPSHPELPSLYLNAMQRLGRSEEAQSLLSEIGRRRTQAREMLALRNDSRTGRVSSF